MIIGIDPGKSGAACLMDENGGIIEIVRFDTTEHDIAEVLGEDVNRYRTQPGRLWLIYAFIEKVHAMPKQGVSSTFKFGKQYGFILGLLTAYKIPYEFVTPHKWQKDMGCLSKGDKNITKAAAQRLFPQQKVIHATADAILIAEYGRRIRNKILQGPAEPNKEHTSNESQRAIEAP